MDPSRASIAVATCSEGRGRERHGGVLQACRTGGAPLRPRPARLTTVLAMTYIIAVNPLLLAVAGVPSLAAISDTCPCGCHGHPHGRLLQPPARLRVGDVGGHGRPLHRALEFIAYVVVAAVMGELSRVRPLMWVAAVAFLAFFVASRGISRLVSRARRQFAHSREGSIKVGPSLCLAQEPCSVCVRCPYPNSEDSVERRPKSYTSKAVHLGTCCVDSVPTVSGVSLERARDGEASMCAVRRQREGFAAHSQRPHPHGVTVGCGPLGPGAEGVRTSQDHRR